MRQRIPREYHQHQHLQKITTQFKEQPKEGPQKCLVYLRLSWIGNMPLVFEKQTKSAIKECYSVIQPWIISSTKKILLSIYKDHVYTYHSTKYGPISIHVLLWLPVRGLNFV